MTEQDDLRQQYLEYYSELQRAKDSILDTLIVELRGLQRVDQVTGRVKDPDSFVEKAFRRGYEYPLEEIQDQIGFRIVVYYLSDVQLAADRIVDYFHAFEHLEMKEAVPEHFSYRARHFICQIPITISDELKIPIEVFEIQINTLFQHAWAEANHDLGYKSTQDLTDEQKRLFAFAAAQAWGADMVFERLLAETKSRKEKN